MYEGKVAITMNSYGAGKVYYVGCDLDSDSMNRLVQYIAKVLQIRPLLKSPHYGIEAIERMKDGKRYVVLLNHTGKIQEVMLDGSYIEFLSGRKIKDSIRLDNYSVAILTQ